MRSLVERLRIGLCVASFLVTTFLLADDAVVTHNVNLRQGPSVSQPLIRLLKPPDRLTLLEPQATNDYLHVRTDSNEEGWVWDHNVRVIPAGAEVSTLGAAAPAGATSLISEAWDKPDPQSGTFTSEGKTCGPSGQDEDTGTNLRKNRTDIPASYHDVTLDAIATLDYPKDAKLSRADWKPEELDAIKPYEGVALRTVGYVVALKPQTGGSGESTNCHMTKAAQVDWHVALVKEAGEGEKTSVVIETTPRVRKNHPKWTPVRLHPWLDSDNPVRISGWLLMDPKHRNHLGKYRSTLWEIHPITKIEVWKDGGWVDLDALP